MARGKAAQANLGQIGRIQHKKIEKVPTKKEREMLKTTKVPGARDLNGKSSRPGQAPLRSGQSSRGNSREPAKAVPEPVKKVKKAATATTGYTGTARPNPATMKKAAPAPRPSAAKSSNYRSSEYDAPRRYRYASEDEDEDEEEDGYNSEASSDMEAAAYEVDEEEELAARIARKEDEEALKEENRLKEEKRRRLAALAKGRR
jgi:protein SPT2